jgi:hypothetical protein
MVSPSLANSRASPVSSISQAAWLDATATWGLTPPWRGRTDAGAQPHPTAEPGPGPPEPSPMPPPGFHARARRSSRSSRPPVRRPLHAAAPAPHAFPVRRHPGLLRSDPCPAAGPEVVHGFAGTPRHYESTTKPRKVLPVHASVDLACTGSACFIAPLSSSVSDVDRGKDALES